MIRELAQNGRVVATIITLLAFLALSVVLACSSTADSEAESNWFLYDARFLPGMPGTRFPVLFIDPCHGAYDLYEALFPEGQQANTRQEFSRETVDLVHDGPAGQPGKPAVIWCDYGSYDLPWRDIRYIIRVVDAPPNWTSADVREFNAAILSKLNARYALGDRTVPRVP